MSVVVGWSDTAEGRTALQRGAQEARLRSLPLEVLDLTDVEAGPAAADRVACATAAATAVDLPAHRVRVTAKDAHQDVASALLDHAVSHDAVMLVIGTRRRSAVGKFLLGSTAQRVLLDADVPVLVVKADAPR